jgi:ADP-ribosyl-[dinitrogen reductase] hydrolase
VSGSPIPHSYWVIPGSLLAGEYPIEFSLAGGPTPLERLLEAGVDCFVDLTQLQELVPYQAQLPKHVRYFRCPVADHSVPKAVQQMRDILATLERELASGRCVYVHCRAGIGRTGTVVGCYLVEQGLTGDGALDELNRVWQQNTLSEIWPEVPETEAQRQYVLDWTPPAGAQAFVDTEVAVRSLRDRFLGSLLGLAVGDALAATTQLRRAGSFTGIGDMLGGGPYDLPRGAWSDDTAMALCLADSLIACGKSDTGDQLARYLRWKSGGYLSATGQCVGITAATAQALARAQWRNRSFAGSHDPARSEPEPLSRVAPAVMHGFGDVQRVHSQVAEATRVTCQSPRVLECARLQAAMLQAALHGEPKERVLTPSSDYVGSPPLRADVLTTADELRQPAGADAPGALAAARRALASAGNFRDGALLAVNMGGNSDVIGAIYGQLAGAYYGVNAIPRAWRAAVAQRAKIEEFADQLLTQALVRMANVASTSP